MIYSNSDFFGVGFDGMQERFAVFVTGTSPLLPMKLK